MAHVGSQTGFDRRLAKLFRVCGVIYQAHGAFRIKKAVEKLPGRGGCVLIYNFCLLKIGVG